MENSSLLVVFMSDYKMLIPGQHILAFPEIQQVFQPSVDPRYFSENWGGRELQERAGES